jgi:hypothetical protein
MVIPLLKKFDRTLMILIEICTFKFDKHTFMNKLLLACILIISTINSMMAQENYMVGIKVGEPAGSISEFFAFTLAVEMAYIKPVSSSIRLGASVGYTRFFGDKVDVRISNIGVVEGRVEDQGFVPVVFKSLFNLGNSGFGLGADLGYAIGVDSINGGGFQYEPKIFYDTGMLLFTASYQSISLTGGNFNNVQFGVAYQFR